MPGHPTHTGVLTMRSRFEGFSIEATNSSCTLQFAVHYYDIFVAAFDSYADCVMAIHHWAHDAHAFSAALDAEFDVEDWRTLNARVIARNRVAEVERLR